MTVRDLIDRLIAGIQSGELHGSDPVPAEIFQDENLSVVEYLAGKYKIGGGDGDGDNQGAAAGLSEQKG